MKFHYTSTASGHYNWLTQSPEKDRHGVELEAVKHWMTLGLCITGLSMPGHATARRATYCLVESPIRFAAGVL